MAKYPYILLQSRCQKYVNDVFQWLDANGKVYEDFEKITVEIENIIMIYGPAADDSDPVLGGSQAILRKSQRRREAEDIYLPEAIEAKLRELQSYYAEQRQAYMAHFKDNQLKIEGAIKDFVSEGVCEVRGPFIGTHLISSSNYKLLMTKHPDESSSSRLKI